MRKSPKLEVIEPLEKKLWKAADKLRKNMDAAEYKHIVLGLIFLKVFGITQRNTPRDMVRYGAYCFTLFIVGVIGAGWAMWLLRH